MSSSEPQNAANTARTDAKRLLLKDPAAALAAVNARTSFESAASVYLLQHARQSLLERLSAGKQAPTPGDEMNGTAPSLREAEADAAPLRAETREQLELLHKDVEQGQRPPLDGKPAESPMMSARDAAELKARATRAQELRDAIAKAQEKALEMEAQLEALAAEEKEEEDAGSASGEVSSDCSEDLEALSALADEWAQRASQFGAAVRWYTELLEVMETISGTEIEMGRVAADIDAAESPASAPLPAQSESCFIRICFSDYNYRLALTVRASDGAVESARLARDGETTAVANAADNLAGTNTAAATAKGGAAAASRNSADHGGASKRERRARGRKNPTGRQKGGDTGSADEGGAGGGTSEGERTVIVIDDLVFVAGEMKTPENVGFLVREVQHRLKCSAERREHVKALQQHCVASCKGSDVVMTLPAGVTAQVWLSPDYPDVPGGARVVSISGVGGWAEAEMEETMERINSEAPSTLQSVLELLHENLEQMDTAG